MITGTVSPHREALIRLKTVGPAGQEQEIDAVIDTGFTGELTLPSALITALNLTWLTQGQAAMANGQIDTFDVYAATVMWDGIPRRVIAEEAETEPLVGMSLLYGYKMTMETVDGGQVTIERI